MNSFTIKDLEVLSGIKAHTIRIWEQRYALLSPQRTETNIRFYDNDDLKNLLNIALLNKYGYKISHITNMNAQQIRDKILLLNDKEAEVEKYLTKLIQYMVDLDLENFEGTLNNYIHHNGLSKTMTKIIFPFLQKIGILWQTDNINPTQEHLVTNLIRQKIIVGIEHLKPDFSSNKTVLLFMPEGEYHELGLLYVNYLLLYNGVRTIYFGANVPLKDLPQIIQIKKPDYLYTHITSLHLTTGFERFLNNSRSIMTNTTLVISGIQAQNYTKALPENYKLMKSLEEVNRFIDSL